MLAEKFVVFHFNYPTVEYVYPYFLNDTNTISYLIFTIQGVIIMYMWTQHLHPQSENQGAFHKNRNKSLRILWGI